MNRLSLAQVGKGEGQSSPAPLLGEGRFLYLPASPFRTPGDSMVIAPGGGGVAASYTGAARRSVKNKSPRLSLSQPHLRLTPGPTRERGIALAYASGQC
jgi:hypothetical protein